RTCPISNVAYYYSSKPAREWRIEVKSRFGRRRRVRNAAYVGDAFLKQNCERDPFKPTGKITLALQPPIKFGPQWHMLGIYPDGQDTSLAARLRSTQSSGRQASNARVNSRTFSLRRPT